VEFRVLGPLSVTHAGEPVYLDYGHKTRLLLAILLARAPRVVPIDDLLSGLWGEQPPRSARANIHQYVHRLRLALGVERIRSHAAGYALSIPDEDLDAARFRALAAGASTDFSGGHTSAANVSLRSALDVWSGPAFAGFLDCELVTVEATRLEQHRLSIHEQWAETELELGRHRELIENLTELAETHPYRETLRAQLMLALHRSGRRAEALELYRRTRAVLVAELGVEPGESLQQLHQAILRGVPGTGDGNADATAHKVAALNQLPPLFAPFVGRRSERAKLVDALMAKPATSPAVVGISGMGGLGKTSIAVWAAHSVLGSFPDGCLFADLRGTDATSSEPHGVLGAFLRAIGIPGAQVPQSRTERLGLYRSVTAGRRLLIVLDNAHSEAQVRPLVPAGPQCAVIITSRRSLSGLDQTHTAELNPLADSDSVELLHTGVPPQVLDDSAGIDELLRWCGGLPLAIRIIAGRLRSKDAPSPTRLARMLRDAADPVDELHLGDLNVRNSFMLSYRRLSSTAATLLGHLARLGQPDFTVHTCVPLVDGPGGHTALAELAEANLVGSQYTEKAETARYRMHDLVRSFAVVEARTEPDDHYRAALKRLAEDYVATIGGTRDFIPSSSDQQLPMEIPRRKPFANEATALNWLDDEVDNLVAAVSTFADAGLHAETWHTAYLLRPYLRLRHRSDDRHSVSQTGLHSARQLGDRLAEGYLLESLAGAHQDDDPKDPRARQLYLDALHLFREAGNDLGAAISDDQLGAYYQHVDELDLAEQHHRRALAVPAYANDPMHSCRSRCMMGTLYGRQHRYEDAIGEFRAVLAASVEAGDDYMACIAHHNLAFGYRLLGRHDDARHHVEAEIEIARNIRNTLREARGWDLLGDILADHDQPAATTASTRAVELYERIGDERAHDLRRRLL
jgi:DNA-binding SARP family transcriptional activator